MHGLILHFNIFITSPIVPTSAVDGIDIPYQQLEESYTSLAGRCVFCKSVGKEVARILYSKNAKVYMAARSEPKVNAAMGDIKEAHPTSKGTLTFVHLDLNDLSTIKASAEKFLSLESKLHVLFNNAGVQTATPDIPKTVQGYEHHLGINCLGTFLFTELLTPTLVATAQAEKSTPGSVRVVWVSSSGTEIGGEKSVGIHMDNLDYHVEKDYMYKYAVSKTGNWMHGVEYAKRHRADGVISIPLNPGNLMSDLYRDAGLVLRILTKIIMYPPVNGVVPFGRIYPIRKDLVAATKLETEGGNGTVLKFWDWTEDQVKPYL
ncbi:NAD(P)-binding protein [Whalleya microplaca]|nr:NAD(P)-binding protein [Whalleya microplaca]